MLLQVKNQRTKSDIVSRKYAMPNFRGQTYTLSGHCRWDRLDRQFPITSGHYNRLNIDN